MDSLAVEFNDKFMYPQLYRDTFGKTIYTPPSALFAVHLASPEKSVYIKCIPLLTLNSPKVYLVYGFYFIFNGLISRLFMYKCLHNPQFMASFELTKCT